MMIGSKGVTEASNGVEAMDVFDNWSPHAVLMDMRMPIMDGYEATRRIKAMAVGSAIPVIAVTASAFEDDFEQIMATGMYAYLRKPFRTEDLFEMLGKCLGLHYVFADDTADTPGLVKAAPLTRRRVLLLSALRTLRRTRYMCRSWTTALEFPRNIAKRYLTNSARYHYANKVKDILPVWV
jgi:CheY-like chemotaxis protein